MRERILNIINHSPDVRLGLADALAIQTRNCTKDAAFLDGVVVELLSLRHKISVPDSNLKRSNHSQLRDFWFHTTCFWSAGVFKSGTAPNTQLLEWSIMAHINNPFWRREGPIQVQLQVPALVSPESARGPGQLWFWHRQFLFVKGPSCCPCCKDPECQHKQTTRLSTERHYVAFVIGRNETILQKDWVIGVNQS